MMVARDYWTLCKPRVVFLMLITAWVGMFLAIDGPAPWRIMWWATFGIALAASSAAVINHLVEQHIDIHMRRTQRRPIAAGRIQSLPALMFSLVLGSLGLSSLYFWVNPLTCLLTGLTLIGYAIIYTMVLKKASPQNIVIGGLAGALPPLLGWTAISNNIHPHSWLLVLIIFTWTPPHFWALAIARREDYRKAKLPMLPVTHGVPFTKLCIILYTILLFPVTLLPYLTGMSGLGYAASSQILNIIFMGYAIALARSDDDAVAMKCFWFSIVYLFLLFIFLLWDHYYQWVLI